MKKIDFKEKTLRYFFYLILFLFSFQPVFAQEEPKNSIAIRHDNDFFLGTTDRYYSFGNFIDYRRRLSSDFIFRKREDNSLQLNFSLSQQGFTPDQQDEIEVEVFDYPFSGWLSLSSEIVSATEKNAIKLKLELGVTGDASLAGQLQQWYHDFLNIGDRPTWVAQIPGAFLVNVQGNYTREFALSEHKKTFLSFLTNGSLGIKDIFLEQEALFSFGSRNRLHKSALYNFIGNRKQEIYGYAAIGYRYVAHNLLIEGSLFNDDAPFTLDAKNNLFKARFGGSFRLNQNIIKIEYQFNTAETSLSRSHNFVSVVFERNF
ncbi:DUF2219 family protein [Flavobacteriaceae bacterium R38]|nr:DUF2219 family protein [Flavobacteriaceae bacterium R38]